MDAETLSAKYTLICKILQFENAKAMYIYSGLPMFSLSNFMELFNWIYF